MFLEDVSLYLFVFIPTCHVYMLLLVTVIQSVNRKARDRLTGGKGGREYSCYIFRLREVNCAGDLQLVREQDKVV